ncbi:MAG: hypothetical protein ACI8PT_003872 [Gammaproteobacteria bacterium]|jgi:hypothetical protein
MNITAPVGIQLENLTPSATRTAPVIVVLGLLMALLALAAGAGVLVLSGVTLKLVCGGVTATLAVGVWLLLRYASTSNAADLPVSAYHKSY